VGIRPSHKNRMAIVACRRRGCEVEGGARDPVHVAARFGLSPMQTSLLASSDSSRMMRCGQEERVPEFSMTSTLPQDIGSPGRRPPGEELGAAVTALRRGDPVLIRDDRLSVLAIAAELVTEEKLSRLRQASAASPRVVLTRRRAVALGLASREDL